jgi:hypothetical protein
MGAESASSAEAQLVDAIARRVVELLEGARVRTGAADTGGDPEGGCLTVSQIAARYRVSRSWVYAHQRELGAMRLGQGPRARLRFDPKLVAEAITAFDGSERAPEPPVAAPRGRRRPRLIEFETLQ